MRKTNQQLLENLQQNAQFGDYFVYVDGSANNNATDELATVGGVVLNHDGIILDEFSYCVGDLKSAGAELAGIVKACEHLEDNFYTNDDSKIVVFTDNDYAAKTTVHWAEMWESEGFLKMKDGYPTVRANVDIIKQIIALKRKIRNFFCFRRNDEYTNLAHDIANNLRVSLKN